MSIIVDRPVFEEIGKAFSDAVLHEDKEAESKFIELIFGKGYFMDYEKAMNERLLTREDWLVEQDEIRVCAECGNPLIWTFAFAYKERYCINCGGATPMFDGSERQPASAELQFRYWLLNTIWSGLYRRGGLLAKARFKYSDCKLCDERDEDHLSHLTEQEIAANEIAERFRLMLIGRFPMPQKENV